MSIDNVFVHLVTVELNNIVNGRINSVKQINRDEFLFSIYSYSGKYNLLINCNPSTARVCLTESNYSFAERPSNFLLLLKKHLVNKHVLSVEQANNDRIIKLALIGNNQFGDEKIYYLYVELIGNNTNIILCDNAGLIIDSLKKREYSCNTNRAILPGLLYRFPPAPSGYLVPSTDIISLKTIASHSESYDAFIKQINGIGSKLKASFSGYSEFFSFLDYINGDDIKYSCYGSESDIQTLSYYPLKDHAETPFKIFDSPSKAFDYFYLHIDSNRRNGLLTKKISSSISVLLQRRQNKLIKLEEDLSKCSDKDRILKEAELLKANMFAYHKGDKIVRCIDYYSENLEKRDIAVDPIIEPSVYISSLFRKYSKYKTAESVLAKEISKCIYDIEYLESVMDELNRASEENDVSDIEKELTAAGYIKSINTKKNNSRSKAIHVTTLSGADIYIGKNNVQNDELTFHKANKNDVWFHVKDQHGSHVILQSSQSNVSENDITEAAEYAAYYSGSRNSGKTAVDYTTISNIKRNSPYYPGRVIYTNFKTVIVSSNGEHIKK